MLFQSFERFLRCSEKGNKTARTRKAGGRDSGFFVANLAWELDQDDVGLAYTVASTKKFSALGT